MNELIITNARLVLAGEVVKGHLVVRDDHIVALGPGPSRLGAALDLDGDYLLPGLIDLHTDNLEHHVTPRPKVPLPLRGALLAHDAEVVAAGITTVFDAIAVGDPYDEGFRTRDQSMLLGWLDRFEAAGVLRADHRIHARCELPAANARALFEPLAHHPRLGLVSLMDHTPGQRQWSDPAHARLYYTGKKGWSAARFETEVQRAPQRQAEHAEPNRRWFAEQARARGVALATHDDTTPAHVDEAAGLGVTLSEFPTTLEAARQAHRRGLLNILGAPNMVRGGSHSGNVAALTLAGEGLLDILASDYVPASLLAGAWRLERETGYTLAEAVRVASLRPAEALGLSDRGQLLPGLRADLVRVRVLDEHPVVREVWVRGRRVH